MVRLLLLLLLRQYFRGRIVYHDSSSDINRSCDNISARISRTPASSIPSLEEGVQLPSVCRIAFALIVDGLAPVHSRRSQDLVRVPGPAGYGGRGKGIRGSEGEAEEDRRPELS